MCNMTNKILLFALAVFLLSSCKDWGWMEPQEQTGAKVLQTIKGASDCETSTVSWANGEATANGRYNESFSFIVKISGNLSFSYCCESSANATITDNDKVLTRLNCTAYDSYQKIDCGLVSTGDRIAIKSSLANSDGRDYVYIRDIVIKTNN